MVTHPHNALEATVDPTARVASSATVAGRVMIGPGCRIMPGARIVAEAGGTITLGAHVIVLENAVIRATARHDCRIGDHVMIGPQAHVVGAEIDDEVFVATGAAVFHGASVGHGSEVRIHAVVHLRSVLPPGSVVPIGWVAVGNPAVMLAPDRHDAIWTIQKDLNFPGFVYGADRTAPDLMKTITRALSAELAPE